MNDWTGIALLASPSENSGEKEFRPNRKKEQWMYLRQAAIIFASLSLIALIAIHNISLLPATYQVVYPVILVLKAAGIFVTSLLLLFEIDKANPQLQKFCSGGGKVNCNAILSSKAAKLFSWLSWSEVGFYYFGGTFLYMIFAPALAMEVVPLFNLLSLPFILFSLYYQKQVAKQWCILCLAVQILLAMEFLVFVSRGLTFKFPSINVIEFAVIAFLIPLIGWSLIKPVLIKSIEGKRTKIELARLKYNPALFESLLHNQKQITIDPEGLGIKLGNPNASHSIIKVCNPYCGPCAKPIRKLKN